MRRLRKWSRGGLGGQAGEDLGFAGEAAEGAGVEDAGGVAGEGSAVGMGGLGVVAAGEGAVGIAVDGDGGRQREGDEISGLVINSIFSLPFGNLAGEFVQKPSLRG